MSQNELKSDKMETALRRILKCYDKIIIFLLKM